MKFNINDKVKVKLTPYGRQMLRGNYDELRLFISPKYLDKYPYVPIREDKDGWSEWQLWHLMESLGKHCHIGMTDQPFETEIDILDKVKF